VNLLTAFLNIEEFYRRTYWNAPTAVTVTSARATISYSGIQWLNSANQLWLHHPFIRDEMQIHKAAEFFRKHDADYTINFTVPLMDPAADWLRALGYRERVSNPILSLDGQPRTTPNAAVSVVRVAHAQQIDLLRLLYELFLVGPEVARCIVQPTHLEPGSLLRHYVAYVEGVAVGCGSISLSHEVASIWSVGTARPHRRQGVASTLIATMLNDAADAGIGSSLLLASPMGRPLYESMGFGWIGDSVQYGPAGF
jgi:GNAT superfamily N-acetyltransferase